MENDTPAYKSMVYYFSKPEISKSKFKGRPRISLPVKLNNDLQITNRTSNSFFEKYGVRELKSAINLEKLRTLASNRKLWKVLTNEVCDTAKENIAL